MNIDTILDQIFPLPERSKSVLQTLISEIEFPKDSIIIKAGKLEKTIYFIKKGIVRAFVPQENQDVTFWFGKEGDVVLPMKSYVGNDNNYENIQLLEDSVLYQLEIASLRELFETDIHIANWGRKLAEKELVKTEELFISRQFRTASQRYLELLREQPEILQRVQLGYIASFLGITQVSLSRIRAEI
ncbi:Crp/Fnr family transcriptional regulator [Epilithonimonas ginsengisoli]|uniref:Crp/Fnr family transcriptional regulator n=1 Tax=Epilithonimonas ginsengisoli TaxID=1245592 RepID=A0ABU4JKW1_9FLAO|nr:MULTISPECIES: Crp/Fnr family transcriptional regulator [Chryseobacterium group]MBV6881367.1 Crp/Fnr family transcriptional regulator [Epilithonimonas sp. FP105]MDW8550286.1 Crp/Fnr family transcriptional regulator [Epilithonimonas ginsengisoli]OAH64966.1 cyclic nucleotide-binding protein [Chryseobacterium sp. FP211-J200]